MCLILVTCMIVAWFLWPGFGGLLHCVVFDDKILKFNLDLREHQQGINQGTAWAAAKVSCAVT